MRKWPKTRWVQPDRMALLTGVRDIVANNPERHQQETWLSNALGYVADMKVEEARAYISTGIPEFPEDPARPVCGTTACLAGWIAIMAAPPGSIITSEYMHIPGQAADSIARYARKAAGLDEYQAAWLFDGDRYREEIIDALDQLIVDPEAQIGTVGYED